MSNVKKAVYLITLITSFIISNIFTLSNAQTQQSPFISKLSLVRADNGTIILDNLSKIQNVNIKDLPTLKINLVATLNNRSVRKVEFITNNTSKFTDNSYPFSYKGDDGGNFNAWTPNLGSYNISITAFDKETLNPGTPSNFIISFSDSITEPSQTPNTTPSPTQTPTSQPSAVVSPSPSPTPLLTPSPVSTIFPSPIASSPTSTPTKIPPTLPSATPQPSMPLKAFPGAQGFGSETVAGSGRHLSPPRSNVFYVYNLNNNGSGSLKACIDAIGPRVCVFNISGKIKIEQPIQIINPYLTIAGQTAPYPGITLIGAGLQVKTHDVLIQHLRIRVGDSIDGPPPAERDGIVVWGTQSKPAYNIVIDHTSISWSVDENFSTYGGFVNNLTLSNSIISEALLNSIHPKGRHSMGMLIGEGSQKISINKNLFAHNHDRNLRILPGTSVEFISNHVYNWGGTSGWNVANISDTNKVNNATFLNFIGNNYKMGLDSTNVASVTGSPANSKSKVFVLDNLGPKRTQISQNEWLISSLNESSFRLLKPTFPLSDTLPISAISTPNFVLLNSGSRPKEFNFVDQRVKREVQNKTGRIKDCLLNCTNNIGVFDSDTSNYRELQIPARLNDDDNLNGYTNLEDWLHSFYFDVQ